MKVIYISGPMTGIENYNFPAFNLAADMLRRNGFNVLNPADFGANPKHTWADCLKRDLLAMFNADVVVTLPGAEKSKGAGLETHVARELGIPVVTIKEFINEYLLGTPKDAAAS
jgi:hypothetical protein